MFVSLFTNVLRYHAITGKFGLVLTVSSGSQSLACIYDRNIFCFFFSEPEYKFRVNRENFFPQPKVVRFLHV
jgi:hypothetical protein